MSLKLEFIPLAVFLSIVRRNLCSSGERGAQSRFQLQSNGNVECAYSRPIPLCAFGARSALK